MQKYLMTNIQLFAGHKSRRGLLKSDAVPSQNLLREVKKPISSISAQMRTKRMQYRENSSIKNKVCLEMCVERSVTPVHIYSAPELEPQPESNIQTSQVNIDSVSTRKSHVEQPNKNQIAVVKTNASVQVNTLDYMFAKKISIIAMIIKSDKSLNTWTGIPTFEVLEKIQGCVEMVYERIHGFPSYSLNQGMTLEEKVVLCFMKIKTNMSMECIAHLFQINASACSRVFTTVISMIRIAVQCVIYFPSVEETRSNLPKCFQKDFVAVRSVLDCTEIQIQIPKCINCKISSYSNYKNRNTLKYLISVTPAGTISFVSSGYSGKSSDKFVVNSEKLLDKFEFGDAIMVDKGFLIEEECAAKGIQLVRPTFFQSHLKQFEAAEVISNTKVAVARVHVERVIGRMKIFDVMTDKVEYNLLPQIDDIVYIIAAIVNICSPILDANKF